MVASLQIMQNLLPSVRSQKPDFALGSCMLMWDLPVLDSPWDTSGYIVIPNQHC